jgi:hypothetical protein
MALEKTYKKISRPVTPAQDRFGKSIGRLVNKFVDVKGPKRKRR